MILVSRAECTHSTYGTLGFGFGFSPITGEHTSAPAICGTLTHCLDGHSVSLRLITFSDGIGGVDRYGNVTWSTTERVSEVSVMGGWDYLPGSSSLLACRLGIGRLFYSGGNPPVESWDHDGKDWGLALQFDAFWRRTGLSWMIHTGKYETYKAFMLCFKIGRIDSR
jgi:hypothetical protein